MNAATDSNKEPPAIAAAEVVSHAALNEIAGLARMALDVLNYAVEHEDSNMAAAAATQIQAIGFIADAATMRLGHVPFSGGAEWWLMSPVCRRAFDPAGGAE